MTFKFTPEHFSRFGERQEAIACLANNILEDFVKTLPELSGGKDPRDDSNNVGWTFGQFKSKDDTHRARLWNIEEIEPCEKQLHAERAYSEKLREALKKVESIDNEIGDCWGFAEKALALPRPGEKK